MKQQIASNVPMPNLRSKSKENFGEKKSCHVIHYNNQENLTND
jgi:hypothetical protein